jgi:hypothetical protein
MVHARVSSANYFCIRSRRAIAEKIAAPTINRSSTRIEDMMFVTLTLCAASTAVESGPYTCWKTGAVTLKRRKQSLVPSG